MTGLTGDFLQSVTKGYIGDPKKVRNAAIRLNYHWVEGTRGKPMSKIIGGGGQSVNEVLQLANYGTFASYATGETLTAGTADVLSTVSAPWRFGYAQRSYHDQQKILNGAGSEYTSEYRYQKLVDMVDNLFQGLYADVGEGMESKYAALPNALTMEAAAGKEPYSAMTWLNDHPNGLFQNIAAGSTFTTIGGITPTAANQKRYRIKRAAYNSTASAPASGAFNIVNAFEDLRMQLHYKRPMGFSLDGSKMGGSGDPWESDQWGNLKCKASRRGRILLMEQIRQQGDRWTQRTNADPSIVNPMHEGVEIEYWQALDNGTYYLDNYSSATANVAEGASGAAGIGPRYLFQNTDAMNVVFHRDKVFEITEARHPTLQPFSQTHWLDVYYQFFNTHPHLCGIISPGTVSGEWPDQTYTPAAVYTAWQ